MRGVLLYSMVVEVEWAGVLTWGDGMPLRCHGLGAHGPKKLGGRSCGGAAAVGRAGQREDARAGAERFLGGVFYYLDGVVWVVDACGVEPGLGLLHQPKVWYMYVLWVCCA